jgi:hypothetical protein
MLTGTCSTPAITGGDDSALPWMLTCAGWKEETPLNNIVVAL